MAVMILYGGIALAGVFLQNRRAGGSVNDTNTKD